MSKTMAEATAAALFQVESVHQIHGTKCLCGFESHVSRDRTKHITEATHTALSAAGFGLVADAKAEALEEAADEWATRSETFLDTMQNMAASREYGHDDVLRYGAYSAEAQTTSFRLRTKAAVERNQS